MPYIKWANNIVLDYATDSNLFRLDPKSDGTLALMWAGANAEASPPGSPLTCLQLNLLSYRADGTFAADSNPLDSLRVVSASGTQFLIRRKPEGYGHYLDESEFGQRVTGTGGTLSIATLPPGTGPGDLQLYGATGGSISVTLP